MKLSQFTKTYSGADFQRLRVTPMTCCATSSSQIMCVQLFTAVREYLLTDIASGFLHFCIYSSGTDVLPLRSICSSCVSCLWLMLHNRMVFNTPFTRYSRLSNRLYNRFDNWLYRVNKHPTGCQTGLYNRFDNRLYARYNRL